MCDPIGATSVPGMDLYDAPVDIDDLAFMSLIACLDESTQALMDRMRAIRELNGKKAAINDEIDRLTQALDASGAEDDDDLVDVPGGIAGEPDAPDVPDVPAGDPQPPVSHSMTYSRKQVQDEIERLRRQLEDLSASSEIMLIDLNRLMSKRNEAITLTSNILSTCHQSAMSVIANFKG